MKRSFLTRVLIRDPTMMEAFFVQRKHDTIFTTAEGSYDPSESLGDGDHTTNSSYDFCSTGVGACVVPLVGALRGLPRSEVGAVILASSPSSS
jgi:hypothetical protein